MGGVDGVEKVYGCVPPHGWMLKNWLPEQSRQWKGDSSASMVEPQEHRKGPGAQTSEDAGGSNRRIRRDMVYVCMCVCVCPSRPKNSEAIF